MTPSRPMIMRPAGVLVAAAAALLALTACTSSSTGATDSSGPAPATVTTTAAPSAPVSSSAPSSPAPTTAASSGSVHPAAAGPSGGAVPGGFTPVSVTFVSATHGWTLGTAPCSRAICTSILRTRDGAKTWSGIPAPVATLGQPDSGRNGDVSVLRFADDSNGWAGVGKLFSTHDGGAHWTAQHIGPSGSTVASIETGGGYVFATTDDCPSMGASSCSTAAQVYASPIGSDHWSRITSGSSTSGSGLAVHGSDWFQPTTSGILRGSGTTVLAKRSNPCPSEGGSRPAPVLAVVDATHLDAMCTGEGAAGSASYQLYGTTDGGAHWTKTGSSHREDSGFGGIADNGAGVLLAAVASGNSAILRTTDDGGHFANASVSAPTGGFQWADLGFTTSTQAVVVLLSKGLYLSHDAGKTFTRVTF